MTARPVDAPDTATSAGPVRDDAVTRGRALLIARLVIGLYLVELLLNLTRPHLQANEPVLSIFQSGQGLSGQLGRLFSMPETVFWIVLAGIVVGFLLQIYAAITRPEGRRARILTWATLIALLGPFGLIPLAVIAAFPLPALACVPSTAFVVWLLHHGQRFARLPLPVLLIAVGWGALGVFGLGRAYTGLAYGTLNGYLGAGAIPASGAPSGAFTQAIADQYRVIDYLILHLSVVNELALAAGVLLLLLVFGHRVTDMVTGLVLGAAAGAGYGFVESAMFIRLFGMLSFVNGATGGFEYWIRQSIGLLGGQVTFGALLGAGLGLALRTRRRRYAGFALLTAIGGAVATEVLSAWLSHLAGSHGGVFGTLVTSPFFWLLPQAPFIVLAVLLLRAGWRERDAAARAGVGAEAQRPGGAIGRAEAPFLIDPGLRMWALVSAWSRYGAGTARALYRLQCAQLDLAGWRYQRLGAAEDDADRADGERLRTKVLRLKGTS